MATVTKSDRPKLEHPRLEGFVQLAVLEAKAKELAEAMKAAPVAHAAEALAALKDALSWDHWNVIENMACALSNRRPRPALRTPKRSLSEQRGTSTRHA